MPRGIPKNKKPAKAEQAPAWAKEMLQKLDDSQARISSLENWVQRTPMNLKPEEHKKVVQPRWYRCEDCNERFESMPILPGNMMKCSECAEPGKKQVRCVSCKKQIKVKPNELKNAKCKRCKHCVECGVDPRGEEVCAKCIADGVRICDGCLRPPMNGSAFCRSCDAAWRSPKSPPAAAFRDMEPAADAESCVPEVVLSTPEPGTFVPERPVAIDIVNAGARMG